MRVVIAGAGAVGTHLSQLLSRERHNVVLLDTDTDKLNQSSSNAEVMTMEGSATSLKDLEESGVKNSELFIAVTEEESVNITASMLATKMGAKKAFARIDNSEYLLPQNKVFFESMGINAMVYPEMLAAKEIVLAVERPWAQLWVELFGGKLILVGVKMGSESQLVDKFLSEIGSTIKKFHIVAIKRDNVTLIPNGSDTILVNDILYFTTTQEYVDDLPKVMGKKDFEVKDVMIMGGSRIGIRTAQYLPSDIRIKLLDWDKSKCHKLLEQLPKNTTVFHQDGRNADSLINERIKDIDTFIAVTGNSEANILACMSAKRLGVKQTIAEIENMDYISMAETLDIGTIINKKLITVSNIYRFLLNTDTTNVKSLTFANADVAEITVPADSKVTKKKVKDLSLPNYVTLGGLVRNNKPIMIEGDTQVQENDKVVVFCIGDNIKNVERLFN